MENSTADAKEKNKFKKKMVTVLISLLLCSFVLLFVFNRGFTNEVFPQKKSYLQN